MSEELRNCPFCGGPATDDGVITYSRRMVEEEGLGQREFYFCNCRHCGCSNKGLTGHRTKDAAVSHWNTRRTISQEQLEKGAMAFCESPEYDGGNAAAIFAVTEHSGDCTKQPWTCAVCEAQECRDIVRAALRAMGFEVAEEDKRS